ncbi:MAG: RluA family pseudouridine synthase [Prevotella sp.]|nr:RluA family pseudouridine synthase [Prevotella sp.]
MRLHVLQSDIPKPERFTYPFCYEPHPLCILAAEEVKREIERIQPSEGKMFGVLVVEVKQRDGSFVTSPGVTKEPSLCYMAAYSGLLEGRNDWPYFVPPVFDAQQHDGYFKQTEREISIMSHHSPLTSKKMSQDLQLWLFHQYRMLNARGEEKDLVDIWQDYHCSPRIRRRYPLPPGGTGDCCAPKLLQYAYQHDLKPLCMAEFWWGPPPKSEVRHHGQFYPACRGKCKPVLTWMLQGLDVDPSPDAHGFPHLAVEIVWEDETIAVLNKPSGMLSIPGRTEDYSIATWAQQRWPGSQPAHRLDMWTSGIILVAKTQEAYHHLQRQFEEHTIKKRYLAVVEGTPKAEHGIIDLPLLCDPINRPRQVVDYEHGKRAITEYRVLTPPNLLALWPHTGRTHQLRMHCAHPDGLGCPIKGDELYGRKADRLYLQAQAISFVHPITGRKMHFELPNEFDNITHY